MTDTIAPPKIAKRRHAGSASPSGGGLHHTAAISATVATRETRIRAPFDDTEAARASRRLQGRFQLRCAKAARKTQWFGNSLRYSGGRGSISDWPTTNSHSARIAVTS